MGVALRFSSRLSLRGRTDQVTAPLGNWGVQFSFPKLNNGRWDFDILAFFQPFLTLNQVVDAVHHQLDQLHLETHSNRIVAQTGRYIELMHVSLLA